jgi:hypothetical protein
LRLGCELAEAHGQRSVSRSIRVWVAIGLENSQVPPASQA